MADEPTWGDAPELLEYGWHRGLEMALYLADPGVSNSILQLFADAPALAKAALDGLLESGETKATLEGELIHTALLEPDELDGRYIFSEPCQEILGSGQRKGERCLAGGKAIDPKIGWVCGRHGAGDLEPPEQSLVSPEQLSMARAIRDNAHVPSRPLHHPDVRKILEAPGESELTGIFRDPTTGERGRIRIDRWLERGWSVDVKTVREGYGAAHRYARHMWNLGGHIQQGWYGHGSEVLERPIGRHVHLVVERVFPHIIQPYLLPAELVDLGRTRALESLVALADCRARGEWPGYSDKLEELELLGWQKALIERARAGEILSDPSSTPPDDFGLF